MEWVETTGKSVEDALDHALDQLGVDESDVEYSVVAEPRTGLFGRLKQEARVRARVKPLSRDKPDDRDRRGRRKGRGDGSSSRDRSGAGSSGRKRAGGRGGDSGGRSPAGTGPRGRGASQAGSGRESDEGPGGDGAPRPRRRRRRRSGGRRRAVSSTEGSESTEGKVVDEDMAVEEQAEMAVEFARGLVEAFGADATVSSTVEDEDNVLVEVTGEDLGLLVGPKGATLAAVEELVRTVVQRGTAGGSARVHVDVAGYRARRREALAAFATRVADQVLEAEQDKALEPMSPADRKVVHDTVAEIDGVETVSEGEEPRRRVVIRYA